MSDLSEIVGNPRNFIEEEIEKDIAAGKVHKEIHTRFPPEPNGYLHIGHAKAICLNFGIAQKYGGKTNLRFDDTNPTTEETEYVNAIKRDIKWLGFDWEDREYYASDYFDQLHAFAVKLIEKGLAYVDDSTAEQIAAQKGTPTEAGVPNEYRLRSIEENLALFEGMTNGDFPDGARVLRVKGDLASPNLHMRDPVIYRIKKETHHRTGDKWCIYPMYDFAHGQSDSIENITHSLCSLEFRHHRPLYDWLIDKLEIFPSRQIEFARMNVGYMITSKRKLLRLVTEGKVESWDDPRMSTISGMRRRGYPPAALRVFCDKVGIAKRENIIDMALLESCVRDELNKTSHRVMVVLNPVKVVITNYPEDKTEMLEVENNPEDENGGSREVPFSKEIYIERDDFMVDAPKKFFRLAPGKNVRMKGAYIIGYENHITDPETGEITEIHCQYYPDSKSGNDTSGIKAKGTLHWVSVDHAVKARVRQYDRLFTDPSPDGHEDIDFLEFYNEDSLTIVDTAMAEPSLKNAQVGVGLQFMRKGYFVLDQDSTEDQPIFNRTVTLKDTWSKMQKK